MPLAYNADSFDWFSHETTHEINYELSNIVDTASAAASSTE